MNSSAPRPNAPPPVTTTDNTCSSVSPAQPEAGHADLVVGLADGASAALRHSAQSPLKLLVPRPRGESVWAYVSSFGGGLVAGDETSLDLSVQAGAKLFVSTQASTKVYRNPEVLPCRHRTSANLDAGSVLAFVPDAVQCFAESSYSQDQSFHLDATASLVLVDWLTAGRMARGERWAFRSYRSRNDVFVEGEQVFLDSIRLEADDASPVGQRMGRFNCLASLLLVGPAVQPAAAKLLETIAALSVPRRGELLLSASAVRGGAVLRLAGSGIEPVSQELRRHLAFLGSLLGDDPLDRKF